MVNPFLKLNKKSVYLLTILPVCSMKQRINLVFPHVRPHLFKESYYVSFTLRQAEASLLERVNTSQVGQGKVTYPINWQPHRYFCEEIAHGQIGIDPLYRVIKSGGKPLLILLYGDLLLEGQYWYLLNLFHNEDNSFWKTPH